MKKANAQHPQWKRDTTAIVDSCPMNYAYLPGDIYFHLLKPAFVDIDHDWDLDLFIGKDDGHLIFFRNIGNSTKAAWRLEAYSYEPAIINVGWGLAPAFGDIDGDGDYDLLAGYGSNGNTSHEIFYFQNIGDSLQPKWAARDTIRYLLPDSTLSTNIVCDHGAPALGDMDEDGDLDLVVGDGCLNRIHYFENIGTKYIPVWKKITDFYVSSGIWKNTPALGDFDCDGDLDMAVGQDVNNGKISLYKNVSVGQGPAVWQLVTKDFQSLSWAVYPSVQYSAPAWADINGDHKLDFFACGTGAFHFIENTGGSCLSPEWTPVTRRFLSIGVLNNSCTRLSDFDGDDDLDLFIGSEDGSLALYQNIAGTGNLPKWEFITYNFQGINVGGYAHPTFFDIDRDGDEDLFIGCREGTVYFYRKDSSGFMFISLLNDETGKNIDAGFFSAPTFADLNIDLVPELYVVGSGSLRKFEELDISGINWKQETSNFAYLNNGAGGHVEFYDWNKDSLLDLFTGGVNYHPQDTLNGGQNFTSGYLFDFAYPPVIPQGSSGQFVDFGLKCGPMIVTGEPNGGVFLFQYLGIKPKITGPAGQCVCTANLPLSLDAKPAGGIWGGIATADGKIPAGLVPGNYYTVIYSTITNGCVNADTFTFCLVAAPDVHILNTVDTFCVQDQNQIPATPGGGTFITDGTHSWSYISPYYLGLGKHKIIYKVTDYINQCSGSDTVEIFVKDCVIGTIDAQNQTYLNAIPNPHTDAFTISLRQLISGEVQFSLYNALGQIVWSHKSFPTDSYDLEVNTSALMPGLYLLRAAGRNFEKTIRVVKQ